MTETPKRKCKRYKKEWNENKKRRIKEFDKLYGLPTGKFKVKCPCCGDEFIHKYDVKYKYCDKEGCKPADIESLSVHI